MNNILNTQQKPDWYSKHWDVNSEITEIIRWETIDMSEKDRTNEKIEQILKNIKNPESIKNINLSYNQLTHISDVIFTFTNLENLDLTYNNIASISDKIWEFKKLKKIILTSNPLENNPLPKWIAEIWLEYLEIDNLNKDDEYLRNLIPEIKENRIDTFWDDDDDWNRD
jgi:Leucine-rich repeat (LRR) protein